MSKRILVVEDQEDNRQIIRDMLAGTDYEISEVENGEQALAAIAKQRPDLILMGIQLPIMDGYTATRRIKFRDTTNGALLNCAAAPTGHIVPPWTHPTLRQSPPPRAARRFTSVLSA
jgi:CheY-like chemotaxis protein